MNPAHTELSQAIIDRILEAKPSLSREPLEAMSLASQLDLLFLLRGSWGSLGNFSSTQRAIRHLVGDEAFWRWPEVTKVEVLENAVN